MFNLIKIPHTGPGMRLCSKEILINCVCARVKNGSAVPYSLPRMFLNQYRGRKMIHAMKVANAHKSARGLL